MGIKLTLDQQYLDSPSLSKCTPKARDYWHRIVLASADAYGCFKVNQDEIAARAFPGWGIAGAKVKGWLEEYELHGMLQTWRENGRVYGFWTGWPKFNRIDGRYRRQTPPPPVTDCPTTIGGDAEKRGEMREDAEKFHEIGGSHSHSHSHSHKHTQTFARFWEKFPRKVGKAAAEKAWKAKKPPIDAVLKALEWQKESDQWKRGIIPNPATWINQERWLDEPPAEEKPKPPSKPCKCGHPKSTHKGRCRIASCGCEEYKQTGG